MSEWTADELREELAARRQAAVEELASCEEAIAYRRDPANQWQRARWIGTLEEVEADRDFTEREISFLDALAALVNPKERQ